MSELEVQLKESKERITKLLVQVGTLKKEKNDLNDKYQRLVERGLEVIDEKKALSMSPDIAKQKALMDFQLQMADTFIKSGAFDKSITPEQAYVIIQAGAEIGLKPMESMQTLYIYNGAVRPHSKGMVSLVTRAGWKPSYSNETEDTVDIKVTKGGETIIYKVDVNKEPTLLRLQDSNKFNALKTDRKNKLRYHGIRQILNFNLPHLVGSMDIWDEEDIDSASASIIEIKSKDQIVKKIKVQLKSNSDPEFWNSVWNENYEIISGNMELMEMYTEKKKENESIKIDDNE